METEHQLSERVLTDLPFELLDIILRNSYLHWIRISADAKDGDVIKALISVDFCWSQRITKRRFKKRIWQRLKDLYEKQNIQKRRAIIRNNRRYLSENIQPNNVFFDSLFSFNCLTEEQCHLIQRSSKVAKNDELLHMMRSFDEDQFSNFVKCLRQTNQKTVARVIANGGAVIKVKVQNRGAGCTTSWEIQLLHRKIEELRSKTKQWSHKTDKLINQLKKEGLEILNSQLDRHTAVVWIWCRSQEALEKIQKKYESSQLSDVLFGLADVPTSDVIRTKVINNDYNQLMKTIVVFQISVDFTHSLDVQRRINMRGVTKLRNEIYVCIRILGQSPEDVICVFGNLNTNVVRLRMKQVIKWELNSCDIGSSEKDKCLYVSDSVERCIWKITREIDDEYKIIKCLTSDYEPSTLSVSSVGQLLVVDRSFSVLRIYGSDTELIRSIHLPRDINNPIHAVETSYGNFVILHERTEEEDQQLDMQSRERSREIQWDISEWSESDQKVMRRCIPSSEAQRLRDPCYLAIDSDDQVVVADTNNDRVILLDSNLKWHRILCETNQDKEETETIFRPMRIFYDEERSQLIIGGGYFHFYLGEVNLYTLSLK